MGNICYTTGTDGKGASEKIEERVGWISEPLFDQHAASISAICLVIEDQNCSVATTPKEVAHQAARL